MLSLLNKKPKVETNPYPHVLIEEALPWSLYEKLEAEFPEKQVLSTEAFDMHTQKLRGVESNILIEETNQKNLSNEIKDLVDA